ncbi:hypothetical protein JCM8097_007602, partial [Rhodosporidiobolus ruineniae]
MLKLVRRIVPLWPAVILWQSRIGTRTKYKLNPTDKELFGCLIEILSPLERMTLEFSVGGVPKIDRVIVFIDELTVVWDEILYDML